MSEDFLEQLRRQAEQRLNPVEQNATELVDQEPQSQLERAQRHELQVHQIELELQNEQLQRANLELEEARQEYNDLFDFAPVGYLTLDRDARILRVNQVAARQLSVSAQLLPGRRFTAYLQRSDATTFALFLRRLFEMPGHRTLELTLMSAKGELLAVQLEGEAEVRSGGAPQRCRLAITDISAQRAAQGEMFRLNNLLEAQVQQRTQHILDLGEELDKLAASIRQELYAPLQRIQDASGQLSSDPYAPGALQQVKDSAGRLSELLDAVLRLTRLGRQRLHFKPLDLNRVVMDAWQDARAGYPDLAVQLSRDELPTVSGDAGALRLLFHQLLDNALKFSVGREDIRVRVYARTTPTEHMICVHDNGIGFSSRRRSRLFELFQRLHADAAFPGTGVGLALVRRIALRHSGRVWAESQPGQGATFWVSFPRQDAATSHA